MHLTDDPLTAPVPPRAPGSEPPATEALAVLLRRVVGRVRWLDEHRVLAAQPVFARCTRREIRHLARVGDHCAVAAGEALCVEDRIGHWLFVVVSGEVALSKAGRAGGTLGPGDHVGGSAIVSFGPQPATATTTTETALFVLGRRHVLDLSHTMPSLQLGLFPGVAPEAFTGHVRELRAAGAAAWKQVPARKPGGTGGDGRERALPSSFRVLPPRHAAGDDGLWSAALRSPERAVHREVPARRPGSRRAVAAVLALATAACIAVGATYHPGVLVVRPHEPIDVTSDVEVEGVPSRRPTGRYVLTAVDFAEPSLFGLLAAVARGEERLPKSHHAPDAVGGIDEQLAESQRRAVQVVAARAGVDPAALRVRFRARDLSGPSAGLVYALLLADATGQLTVPGGRVVAATGALGAGDEVLPVGWVAVKGRVAASAHADLFLVPAGVRQAGAVPVVSFDAALRAAAA